MSPSISTIQIVPRRLVAGREAEPLHHVADTERAVGGAEHVLDAVEPGLAGRGAGRPGGCARGWLDTLYAIEPSTKFLPQYLEKARKPKCCC